MAIIRGFIVLIFASLLCSNAIAESKVKRFLKSLENGIKKELRQRIEPRQNNRARKQGTPESGINYSLQRTISGQCSVFGGGEKLDDDPCNREYFCEANRCYHAYVWPSGAKTIVELGKNGVPRNINGSRLKVLRNDNHTCVESNKTKRTFCFLELKKRVVKQEPPQKKVEIQKPKPAQPDRTVKVEALPSEGVYYYSGGQRCGAELRFLQARVKITKWGDVNVLFAYRKIEEDGTPKGFLDSDFIEWETWSDGRKRPIKFALRDDPRKVLAQGGFSEGGRIE